MLLLCLALAGCADSADMLKDVRQVKATVYRHKLAVEPAHVEMPGDRLGPTTTCGGAAAPAGLFDPCRPDLDAPDRDAAGFPRYRWDVAAPAPRPPQDRALRPARVVAGKAKAPAGKADVRTAKPQVKAAKRHVPVAVVPAAKPAPPKRGKASAARSRHGDRRAS